MNCIFRIAVGIVILSACLKVQSRPFKHFDAFKTQVDQLSKSCSLPEDSRFNTSTDLQNDCTTEALNCFLLEMGTVERKCNNTVHAGNVKKYLNKAINELKGKSSSTVCSTCESSPRLPLSDFLHEMINVAERVNSMTNTTPTP